MESASIFLTISAFLICSCRLYSVSADNGASTFEEAFQKIVKKYNKELRPNFDGPPVKVIASSYIVAVDNVNDVKSEFTVKMYFSQIWNDSRLDFGRNLSRTFKKNSIRITGDVGIWTPDTYVENEEGIGSHKVISSVKISKTGTIARSQRLTVIANCPTMNLKLFPHDVQQCILLMTSYAYPEDELTYEWRSHDAVVVGESSFASPFNLMKTQTNVLQRHFKSSNATWTYLSLTFVLKRKIAYYIIRIYLPVILVVLTSWVSFWVNPAVIPARLSLCVITVLAMTTLSYSSQSMVPSVPYVKAVDCYLIVSFFFVFGALLEYAIILNVQLRHSKSKQNKRKTEEIPLNENPKTADGVDVETNGNNGSTAIEEKQHASKKNGFFNSWTTDTFSTVLFPLAFFFFQLIYFTVILA